MDGDQELSVIQRALEDADGVDAERIELVIEDEAVVLRGSVPNAEQATQAQMIAEQRSAGVRNELRVDPNLRATGQGTEPPGHRLHDPPYAGSDVPPPKAQRFDETSSVQEALDESTPLTPPQEPVTAPTRAEARGRVDRDATIEQVAETGERTDPDEVTPSAPDLSQAELERSARAPQEEQ